MHSSALLGLFLTKEIMSWWDGLISTPFGQLSVIEQGKMVPLNLFSCLETYSYSRIALDY